MKSLSEKRDELSKGFFSLREESAFCDGWDSALAEVLPQIKDLEAKLAIATEALNKIGATPYAPTTQGLFESREVAREALEKIK